MIPRGLPESIVLLETPNGWRHSTLSTRGDLICGRLSQVPTDATREQAQGAATAMVRAVAREFHHAEVSVVWEGPDSLTGQVIPLEVSDSDADTDNESS